ncbi:uncharacterized protein [Nicotiana tomentosiformis]|uniref:uncharacterized protein n=1 Tax=Nicotiana tomentosiformis TaxID=4098 RepID=UPI00388C47B3
MFPAPVAAPPASPARGGGHAGRSCPRGGGQCRCYTFPNKTEELASDVVITGIIPVCHRDASVLFDSGYSYVSSYFVSYLDLSRDSMDTPIYVSTPVGVSIIVYRVYCSCLVTIGSYETRVDLLLLNMADFDIMLGMYWLSSYHAILDCNAKTKSLAILGLPRL